MNDLISRQDAIRLAEQGQIQGFQWQFKELVKLPSAQQEPKSLLYYGDGYSEGEMVYDSAECPNCGFTYDEGDNVWGEPYCPHCGQQLDWHMRDEDNA